MLSYAFETKVREEAILFQLNPDAVYAQGGLLRRCHLLQGPPGTGKTRAVVALLQQLSLQRADLDNRILVSAPSNGAVQGPLRAAFIHTRMQYTLALLLKCEKDPTALPEAVQVRIAGVQRSIRVRSG
eukprot:g13283.t1